MTSPTGVTSGSSPRFTTRRTTSRSEKTPTRRSPSSTRTMPTLFALMTCTASLTVSSRCTTKRNPARMISRSFFIASPPVGTGRYRAAAGLRRGAWERAPVGRALECAQGAVQHHHGAAGAADDAGPVGMVVREAAVVEPRQQLLAALADQQEPAAARAGLRRAAGDRDVV